MPNNNNNNSSGFGTLRDQNSSNKSIVTNPSSLAIPQAHNAGGYTSTVQ